VKQFDSLTSDSAFADIVRVHKFHLLTYLLTKVGKVWWHL